MARDKTWSQDLGDTPDRAAPLANPGALVGRVLKNAYRIDAVLGEGGMGVVYRATQIALGRPVAVKTILPTRGVNETTVERFFREARLLSQLQHPNIVHIIDFGTDPGPVWFMVMELLQGQTLQTFVESAGPLPAPAVLPLMEQICAAVSAAHEKGVVHRDLKPANIFVQQVT